MSTDKTEQVFETSQTTVAAYLVYCGHPLVEESWVHSTCTFFFANTDVLQRDFSKYVKGTARVEPQGYQNAYVQVRNRMFKARDDAAKEPT